MELRGALSLGYMEKVSRKITVIQCYPRFRDKHTSREAPVLHAPPSHVARGSSDSWHFVVPEAAGLVMREASAMTTLC